MSDQLDNQMSTNSVAGPCIDIMKFVEEWFRSLANDQSAKYLLKRNLTARNEILLPFLLILGASVNGEQPRIPVYIDNDNFYIPIRAFKKAIEKLIHLSVKSSNLGQDRAEQMLYDVELIIKKLGTTHLKSGIVCNSSPFFDLELVRQRLDQCALLGLQPKDEGTKGAPVNGF